MANVDSGSQAATLDTEHTLTTQNSGVDGLYQVWLDVNAMANGDVTYLRIYRKIRSAGTQRLWINKPFSNVQSEKIWESPLFLATDEIVVKLEQTDGTGRTYEWGLVKLENMAVNVSAIGNDVITASAIAANAIGSSEIADGALTAAKFASGAFAAVWSVTERLLTAGTNIVLAKGTGVTGLNDLDAAGVRGAVGLGSANLDTQLSGILSKLLKYVQLILRKDAAIATDNATEVTAINADGGSGAGGFSNQTDSQEALRDRGDAAWATATGFSTLDAAGVRNAVGLASANLDTQLTAIVGDTNELQTDWVNGGRLDLLVDAIKAKTDALPASPAATGDIPSAASIRSEMDNNSSKLASILEDTAVIGAAGAGLSAVPWNANWDAEVQSEVQDAIEVNHLDHLLAVDYDPSNKPGVGTALLNELIGNDSGVSQFTVNALENAPSSGGGGETAEDIADAVLDELLSGHAVSGSLGAAVTAIKNKTDGLPASPAAVGDIPSAVAIRTEMDNNSTKLTDILQDTAVIGAAGAGLNAVPWNSTWDAEVQSEVQDALEANHLDHLLAADYDPASKPGVATALLNELIGNDAGVSQFTGNALENAPSSGGGGATAEEVRIEMDANSTKLASIKTATDKFVTMIEASGLNWKFTVDALANGPIGEGGLNAETIADAVWENMPDGQIEVLFTTPLDEASRLMLGEGADYFDSENQAITFSNANWPNLTGAVPTLRIYDEDNPSMGIEFDGTVVDADTLKFELSRDDTVALEASPPKHWRYSVTAMKNSHRVALARGEVIMYEL